MAERSSRVERSESHELPLQAESGWTGTTWSARLPVRREQVRLHKRTVVTDHVTIRRATKQRVVPVTADARREELRVELSGSVVADHPPAEQAPGHAREDPWGAAPGDL